MKKHKPAPRPLVRTPSEKLALDYLRDGGVLVHMHSHGATEKQWFVVPGGAVEDQTADRIKQRPDVIGQRDGLWPNHDQTWRMVKL